MSEEGNDQLMKQRLAFVKFLGDSDPEETWRLFCQVITDEQITAWSQSSQKNNIKETRNKELQDVAATVSDTGNDSSQNSHTFTTICGDVIKEIADKVDINTKRALRLTCKKVVDVIDKNWKLKDVHIHLDHHKVIFRCTGMIKDLEFYDRKRKLQDDDQELTSSPICFLQETADKFEQIIQDPKTQLGKLFITCTKENEMARKQDKLLHLILEKIKYPIYVESLKIELSCTNALGSFLKKMKVGSLTELDLFYFSTNQSEDSTFMNIIENPHWVHFKTFDVLGCASNVPMIAYKDVPSLFVRINNVTSDEIKEYKKALLIKRGYLQQKFLGQFDVEEIAEALKPYVKLGKINETKGKFLREDETQLIFKLKKDELTFSVSRFP